MDSKRKGKTMKKQQNQKQAQKKKSHKKLWIILGIVAVVIVAVVIMAVRGLKNMTEQLAAVMENTAVAEKGEILSLIWEVCLR